MITAFLAQEAPMITTFLTREDIPPNLLGLHPGDRVRVVTARAFVRAGYRLRSKDLQEEAENALKDERGAGVRAAYCALLDALQPPKVPAKMTGLPRGTQHRIAQALARDLVSARRFGGPERGVHVVPWAPDAIAPIGAARKFSALVPPVGTELVVDSTYIVQVGTYYAPSYGSPPYYDDAEPGGLAARRPVVVVIPYGHYPHMISGDLARVEHA